VSKAAGCSVVTTYCGHGIGQLFHTVPNVPHYAKNKAKGTMQVTHCQLPILEFLHKTCMYVSQVGHVFTVEPMINLGGYRDLTWPDNWTAVTVDGSRSAQFEHTMVVTETGQGLNL
jgi:methionyl aminopeptidase